MDILMGYLLFLMAAVAVVQCEKPSGLDCKHPRIFTGCNVQTRLCVCAKEKACTNPFPYNNMMECKRDLKGLGDKCLPEPCENMGKCVQVKPFQRRKWKCACAGTGYWGRRCQNVCEHLEDKNNPPADYPSDCIY